MRSPLQVKVRMLVLTEVSEVTSTLTPEWDTARDYFQKMAGEHRWKQSGSGAARTHRQSFWEEAGKLTWRKHEGNNVGYRTVRIKQEVIKQRSWHIWIEWNNGRSSLLKGPTALLTVLLHISKTSVEAPKKKKMVPDSDLMATDYKKKNYQAFWVFSCLRTRLNSEEASTREGQSAASWRLREQKHLAAILFSAAAGEKKEEEEEV